MGILNRRNCTVDEARLEANVIYTAMILGFCATRFIHNDPFVFEEDPSDAETGKIEWSFARGDETAMKTRRKFAVACTLVNNALREGANLPHANVMGLSTSISGLITGRPGGAAITHRARARTMSTSSGERGIVREIHKPKGYTGRGAYVGMIDDPVNGTIYNQVSKRIVVPSRGWIPLPPPTSRPGSPLFTPGIIGYGRTAMNLSPIPHEGMGPLKAHEEEEDDMNIFG